MHSQVDSGYPDIRASKTGGIAVTCGLTPTQKDKKAGQEMRLGQVNNMRDRNLESGLRTTDLRSVP